MIQEYGCGLLTGVQAVSYLNGKSVNVLRLDECASCHRKLFQTFPPKTLPLNPSREPSL
jgi:hypothetical protein